MKAIKKAKKKSEEPSKLIDNKEMVINNDINSVKVVEKKDKKLAQESPLKQKKGKVKVNAPQEDNIGGDQKINGDVAIKPPRPPKSVFILDENRYGVIKKFLEDRGDNFTVIVSGTTEKIKYDGKTYIPFNADDVVGKGFHLSKAVKFDVDIWLSMNADKLVRRERDYKEQLFNLDAIEKNINKVCVSVDINNCYWETIYKIGYITEQTYKKGLKKKEWKLGRNASIGSLDKCEMETHYKGRDMEVDELGKPKRYINRREPEYRHIRHNIIGYVYDVFLKLADQLGDDFLMFLTDCVFTTTERKAEVDAFFKAQGYNTKSKTFEYTNLDRINKAVEWIELKKPDTPKYYRYSPQQLYFKTTKTK